LDFAQCRVCLSRLALLECVCARAQVPAGAVYERGSPYETALCRTLYKPVR
jgi:hypothetical protein